ncbi:MAG: UDP-glucose 6-dehydrogenase, partial [Propionibacteriaceae bacterium]|jgi:UDPglucose 6-dehydrogenase|nr:UDP-glucose 6-dehydrogenase [Propionibacteriaceae bacterium]
LDDRIGPKFLRAGLGYGGGCLPKDIRGLISRAEELGVGEVFTFLREIDRVNLGQRSRFISQIISSLGGDVHGKRIGVWGAAFKPDSDDVRDSPALAVARRLIELGAEVRVYDPAVSAEIIRTALGTDSSESATEAVIGADALAVVTEWSEFRNCDPGRMAALARRQLVFDGRNCLEADRWRAAGWTVVQMGVTAGNAVG